MLSLVKNANEGKIADQVLKVKIWGLTEEAGKHSKLLRKLSLRKQIKAKVLSNKMKYKKRKNSPSDSVVTAEGLNNVARTPTKTIPTTTTH